MQTSLEYIFYDELTLSLTASIKKSYKPILPDFEKVDPKTPLFDHLVPPETSTNHPHAYQTYLMLYQVPDKAIPNPIKISAEPLA